MQEKYLVINAGSSSLKFSLYEMPGNKEIVNGYFEKIGSDDSFYTLKYNGIKEKKEATIINHLEAVITMLDELKNNSFIDDIEEIKGVGHRILHGGEIYSESVVIDNKVMDDIRSFVKLGPLHLKAQIAGIVAMQEKLPNAKQVAVYDTAFHQTIPEENYLYAVPYEWYKKNGVRKYGFHGTSHKYITEHMQELYEKEDVNLIVCHVGSGASISCIKNGKSINTTMGLTPLAGLIMGTRCGDIDPSIIEYICEEQDLTVKRVTNMLNKQGGMLGLTGKNDLRDVEELAAQGNEMAITALKMMKKSIVRCIAEYYVELQGNVDSIVFTAGVGENDIETRKDIVNYISGALNVTLDEEQNEKIAGFKDVHEGKISGADSSIDIYVIPTNEEYMILKDTYELTQKTEKTKKLVK